jgi:hypothetical protein
MTPSGSMPDSVPASGTIYRPDEAEARMSRDGPDIGPAHAPAGAGNDGPQLSHAMPSE